MFVESSGPTFPARAEPDVCRSRRLRFPAPAEPNVCRSRRLRFPAPAEPNVLDITQVRKRAVRMLIEIGERSIEIEGRRVVSFRAVGPEDEPFLMEVYGSTRAEELALTGWDEQQRGAFLKMQLDAQHVHYRGK